MLQNRGGYRSVNENVRADGEVIVCEWHNRVVTDDSEEPRSSGSRPQADDSEEPRSSGSRPQADDSVEHGSTSNRAEPGDSEASETPRAERDDVPQATGRSPVTTGEAGDSDVVAIFSQFQDITERIEREQQLERSTARLEALFENSPDMINVHDTDGNIIDPNPRLCERTGYDASELVDMKVWDVDARIDPAEALAIWEEMAVGDRHRLEGVYRHRDGSTFPVEIHLQRLDLAGEDRFVVISRDISERKARERELQRQNERLEEFVGVVSHDLQNPLNVAGGRLDLAREEYDSEHLDAAARSLDRMDELIADLLKLARGGKRVNEIEPVALADVVEECWHNVATGDAALVVETDRTIRADPGRLQHLLENLLQNSVGHGTTSSRRTEHADDGVEHSSAESEANGGRGDHVTITVGGLDDGFYVEDDGTGIPEEKRTAVFESGYSTAPDGTGFGLAIVEEVVEAHGWSIQVTEGADGGARFEITGVEVE
ncbi:PAS domain S-box protein [Haloplanus aerogenes]|uniref:histidine kinase n=1 Tax=Haloplanus aerogenes TaxID=660522 RepID=A0A3G8R054_9EURY|nr:PAS domain S-box protein [Haloplanus aerogenes]